MIPVINPTSHVSFIVKNEIQRDLKSSNSTRKNEARDRTNIHVRQRDHSPSPSKNRIFFELTSGCHTCTHK